MPRSQEEIIKLEDEYNKYRRKRLLIFPVIIIFMLVLYFTYPSFAMGAIALIVIIPLTFGILALKFESFNKSYVEQELGYANIEHCDTHGFLLSEASQKRWRNSDYGYESPESLSPDEGLIIVGKIIFAPGPWGY